MHTRTAPVRLRFATLLVLSFATCAQAARPQSQVKPSSPDPRGGTQRYVQPPPCLRDVPDLSRYSSESARAVIAKYGLTLADVETRPHATPKGTIIGQTLRPGSQVRCGASIAITVSAGPSRDDVTNQDRPSTGCRTPNLTNQLIDQFESAHSRRPWTFGRISRTESPARPGTILKQSPPPEAPMKCGGSIDVLVSNGTVESCVAPDLTNRLINDVQTPDARRQWTIGRVERTEYRARPGTILKQSLRPGSPMKCGTEIHVLIAIPVSVPPEPQVKPCRVPDLIGLNVARASARVNDAGFAIGSVNRRLSNEPVDTVIAQSSERGALLACGTRLDLAVAAAPIVTPPPVQYCQVPDLLGTDVRVAHRLLGDARLRAGAIATEEFDRPRGTVLGQSLKGGTTAVCGSAVDLRVSAGPKMCPVPDIQATDLAMARRTLADRELQLGRVTREISERTAGTVLGQSPPAHASVVCGSAIDVTVAAPLPLIPVPALQGQETDEARRTLERASLALGSVEHRFDEAPRGAVIDQQPLANTPLRRGSAVNIMISDGPAPRPIPDVRGRDRATASAMLTAAGFRLGGVVDKPDESAPGSIVEQRPAAGTPARPGTLVQVWAAVPVPIRVPAVVGTRESDAAAALASSRLRVGTVETRASSQPRGTVIEQRPPAGQIVTANTAVDLMLAAPMPVAPPPVTPPVTSPPVTPAPLRPVPAAATQTRPAIVGSLPRPTSIPQAPETPPPQVLVQLPGVIVENPTAPVLATRIPDVVGSSASRASDVLRAAGFLVGSLSTTPSPAAAGTVTSQQPAAGQPAAPGTQIALAIAVAMPVQGTLPVWWVVLGACAAAAAAGALKKILRRTPDALPASVTLAARPDTTVAVTLSEDAPLIRSELWLKACPDPGVQTAQGAGPFGTMEVAELR
jgi:beta-lactam-binding protein with PASTA domain